jgi:hypothetical protein
MDNSITFKDFKAMSYHQRYKSIRLYGMYLMCRDKEEQCVMLFQLNDFYVEAYIEKSSGKANYIRCFKNTYELYPYLETINISGIFS